MPEYNVYPSVDENNLFPDPIIWSLANSDRFNKRFSDAAWVKPDNKGASTDINTYVTSGYVGIVSSDAPNLPLVSQGVLEVFSYQSAVSQRFTTYNSRTRVFLRHRTGGGVWGSWNEPGWSPTSILSGADLNTYTSPGNYDIAHSQYSNGPVTPGVVASLEVLLISKAVIQRLTTWDSIPRTFIRRSHTDNVSWSAWTQMPGAAEVEAQKWLLPTIASSDTTADLNKLNDNGTTVIMNTEALNTPVPGKTGYLETIRMASNAMQRFTTYDSVPRVFQRYRGSDITKWSDWSASYGDSANLAAGTDLNTLLTPSTYGVTSTVPNMPSTSIGTLEVMKLSRAIIQRYTSWNPINVYIRRTNVGNTEFSAWELQPSHRELSAIESRLASLEVGSPVGGVTKSSSSRAGYKSAYLALNQASGVTVENVSTASVRWPVTIGVSSHRARLHVRNWSWAYGTSEAPYVYKGAVSFGGLWLGAGTGKTFNKAPTKVLSAFTTNAAGDEYVSNWFSYEFEEDVQHLASIQYTNDEGQTNYAGRGGCWRNTNASDGGTVDPTMELSLTSPFDIWLELEVPESTPILAGFGDSNTVGTGTTLPVHDSWLAQYCRNNRALPMFIANHGSNANSWSVSNSPRWTRFGNVASADALVYFLHQNDLSEGITTDILKQRFKDILSIVKTRITPNVYGATITPGNKASSVDTVRKEFNTWLKSRPEGLLDCFDFAAAVSDNDLVIRPEDSADGLHFKNSGHAKIAAELQKRPVTPRVLTRKEIGRLLA